ncbi:tripartite tricarboxylate transporter permease [Thermococcus sp.]|uniref:tripartite tricarboxylate transporter permease n=1 Tax=Thermococcus sp. TaxID=35749 RepID=UPI0025E0262E|nr:tripartite tricarboxylate transporter permease [Thermococcus sp.]
MLGELLTGILAGTLSGIAPGVHVNTLAAFLSALDVSGNLVLFSMGLVHTFLDAVPSVFLGVPDEGTALGILPAHRLVLKGRGMEVIRIALWASFLAVVFSLLLFPVYLPIAHLYTPEMGRVLVVLIALLLILTENGIKKLYAVFVFLTSGVLGVLAFRLPLEHPYYHLFTGLFGIPVLVAALSSNGSFRRGDDSSIMMGHTKFLGLSFIGALLGLVASLVPAFTASQAALLGSFISRDERSFLAIVFSVNTSNFLFSFVNFVGTGRIRNGIVALMSPLGVGSLRFYASVSLFVAMAVLLYGEPLASMILRLISRLPYRGVNLSILMFLLVLSFLFDNFSGILVLVGAALVGSLALSLGIKRTVCMGVLMLPIILG